MNSLTQPEGESRRFKTELYLRFSVWALNRPLSLVNEQIWSAAEKFAKSYFRHGAIKCIVTFLHGKVKGYVLRVPESGSSSRGGFVGIMGGRRGVVVGRSSFHLSTATSERQLGEGGSALVPPPLLPRRLLLSVCLSAMPHHAPQGRIETDKIPWGMRTFYCCWAKTIDKTTRNMLPPVDAHCSLLMSIQLPATDHQPPRRVDTFYRCLQRADS